MCGGDGFSIVVAGSGRMRVCVGVCMLLSMYVGVQVYAPMHTHAEARVGHQLSSMTFYTLLPRDRLLHWTKSPPFSQPGQP